MTANRILPILLVQLLLSAWPPGAFLFAQPKLPEVAPALAAKEKEACLKQLKIIYEAIQAYRRDHKELPHWLSDLVPACLADASLLICPVTKRAGVTTLPYTQFIDPKAACSYAYEFCDGELGTIWNGGKMTFRNWKTMQMAFIGGEIPILRCYLHDPLPTIAFNGKSYETPLVWETRFDEIVNRGELSPRNLVKRFALISPEGASLDDSPGGIPLRDPATKPSLIDLSAFYTHTLTDVGRSGGSLDAKGDAFAGLPTGVQKLGGVEYDIRGIVGRSIGFRRDLKVGTFPVGFKTPRLRFLQGANTPSPVREGAFLGRYVVHYANQKAQEIPVVYGKHARDFEPGEIAKLAVDEAPIVWVGMSKLSRERDTFVRLHEMTWVNPFPDITIERIDFEPAAAQASIFLVAMTADTDLSPSKTIQPSAVPGGGLANETSLRRTLETIQRAIASQPHNAIFWQAQGILQEKLGQFEEALKTYTEAVDVAKRQPEEFEELWRRILASRSKLLMKLNRTAEAKADQIRARGIPARDANTRPNLIDLMPYYNAGLQEDWQMPIRGNHLANFPPRILNLNGIDFDVRGIIQLSGVAQARVVPEYPESVRGIQLDRVSRALHFLHSTGWNAPDGTEIGHYLVHYADGERARIPVVYGKEVREWWFLTGERDSPPAAWKGTQQRWLNRRDIGARLYVTAWQNSRPDVVISSLDYVSAMTEAAPFLIAITAEP